MNRDKISLEARATLINSRVEFIENEINKFLSAKLFVILYVLIKYIGNRIIEGSLA
jgi:hypothetical protein